MQTLCIYFLHFQLGAHYVMTNVGTYYSPCVDSHCWSVDNVNSWICRLRRICLIFFTKVETHFFLKCTIRKLGPLWADWNCHGNFLVANIGSRNVSEKRHEHSIVAIGIIYTGPIFSTFVISFFKLSSTKIYIYKSNAKYDFFFQFMSNVDCLWQRCSCM